MPHNRVRSPTTGVPGTGPAEREGWRSSDPTVTTANKRDPSIATTADLQQGDLTDTLTDPLRRPRQPPLPRAADGRIVLAVDVSPWLRSDAPTSADRAFCHVYGRGRGNAQLIPGWPYSFVVALEPGRSSWTAPLDVVRISLGDDATAATAAQLRALVKRWLLPGSGATGTHRF